MLNHSTVTEIKKFCEAICKEFNLDTAGIAKLYGKRRHWFAGTSGDSVAITEVLPLDGEIVLLYQGALACEDADKIKGQAAELVGSIDRQLKEGL